MAAKFSISATVLFCLLSVFTNRVLAEDLREQLTLPPASEPSSQNQPPCSSGKDPKTVGQEVVEVLGDEVFKHTGKSVTKDVITGPFADRIKGILGLNNGKSACETVCFVTPKDIRVTAEVDLVAPTGWTCPAPGCLPTHQYFNNDLAERWAAIPGPSIADKGNNKIYCWTAMNWSHIETRVFDIRFHIHH